MSMTFRFLQRLRLVLLVAVVMALSPAACRDHLPDEAAAPDAGGTEAGPQAAVPTFVMAVNGQPATDLTITAGAVAWISVSLSAPPPSPVSASVQLSQLGVLSVIPALVVFDATNYNVPQTLTVTAPKNDSTADANLQLHLTASGYTDGAMNLTIKSTNVQTLLVAPNIITVTQGKTDVFTVRPAFAPAGTMTVAITSSKPTQATASPATLTFTAANYKTPQPITVSGLKYAGTLDASVDLTLETPGLPPTPVSVTVVNTNVQNISLSPSSVALSETGSPGTVGVTLTQPPASPLTVTVTSGNPAAATATPATLIFTTANYATPQNVTITPIHDKDTLDENLTVALTATGLTERDATVAVKDVDVQAIVPSATNVTLNEGSNATFTVALAFDPITPLTVSLLSSNTNSVAVNPGTLTFTTANYATPQTVTIAGVIDANTVNETVSVPLTSPGLAAKTVMVGTIDKDVQALVLNPTTASVQEQATTTVTAQLAFAPVASTTVAVTSSDTTALTVSPATLTFTAANYNAPQTVTLTGVKGAGTTNRTANASFASNGIPTVSAAVTVISSAMVAFAVNPATLTTTEASAPTTFTVALTKAPAADATVSVASSNPAAATAAPATLTFTRANYATPQTVTITPVHDTNTVTDSTNVTLTAAGIASQSVSVTVNDVDVQAIVATPAALSVNQGATATFTVGLKFAPTGTASVSVTSANTAAVTGSPGSLSFTAANYTTPQTVTLTGLADGVATNENVTITLASTGVPNVLVTATKVAAAVTCDAAAALPTPSSGFHNPGLSCVSSSCHGQSQKSFGPFTVAGTLYASAGGGTPVSQATIHLIDGANKDIKLTTASNGNFFTDQAVTFPIKIRASKCPNADQPMVSTVASSGGSCNSCHASGSNQGRIHLP